MSSSRRSTQVALPALLTEFEKVLVLWADHPDQCDRKRLLQLNVCRSLTPLPTMFAQHPRKREVCIALNAVHSKPAEYSQYLRKVLQLIKLPLRQSKPIPWAEIVALKPLSHLNATFHNKQYVEVDEIGVKREELEIDMVGLRCLPFPVLSILSSAFPSGRHHHPRKCVAENQRCPDAKHLQSPAVPNDRHRWTMPWRWIRQIPPVSCWRNARTALRIQFEIVKKQVHTVHPLVVVLCKGSAA